MQKILPKLVPITPYEMYVQRVNATYDSIRKVNDGFSYTPAQFGGIFSQRALVQGSSVLQLIDFQIE